MGDSAPPLSFAGLDLATSGGVRAVLSAFGLRLRPARGQHFLINRRVLQRLLEAAEVHPADTILEVGAGIGTLTTALAERGAHVAAVEVDGRFIQVLQAASAPYPKVQIIHADAMRLDPGALPFRPDKVVANLPYSVASPLLIRLLEMGIGRRLVVMVQDEVASRIVAAPGSKVYGLLSVIVQAYASPAIVARVPRSAFLPAPQVRSAILRLDVRESLPLPSHQMPAMMAVARAAFGQRRKMLRSALRDVSAAGLTAETVEALSASAGVDPRRRGEDLTVEEFARLAQVFTGYDG